MLLGTPNMIVFLSDQWPQSAHEPAPSQVCEGASCSSQALSCMHMQCTLGGLANSICCFIKRLMTSSSGIRGAGRPWHVQKR